jgi:hypothetical protein
MAKINTTPYGENCIIVNEESRFADILRDEIKGIFQEEFIDNLLTVGYNQPTINMKGKAANYRGRYETSIRNLVQRINKELDRQAAPYKIKSGAVGPKGGFGYYIQ